MSHEHNGQVITVTALYNQISVVVGSNLGLDSGYHQWSFVVLLFIYYKGCSSQGKLDGQSMWHAR
jgi:hypothetical protein